jgi:large subunit ribosomal protein L21e
MAHRSHGTRFASRQIMTKSPRKKGLSPITHALQEFEEGEKTNIYIDPSVHNGQPHHRFHGLTGEVVGKQGAAFKVHINDQGKDKILIIRPEHLRKNKK